jgi:hypothetical protein
MQGLEMCEPSGSRFLGSPSARGQPVRARAERHDAEDQRVDGDPTREAVSREPLHQHTHDGTKENARDEEGPDLGLRLLRLTGSSNLAGHLGLHG